MSDSRTNGHRWLGGMTQTLVALLLLSAVTGSIWTAMEVRSLSAKFDARVESLSGRLDRHDTRIGMNRARIRDLERNAHPSISMWGVR